MSWLFSRALVEEYLGESSLDGEPSAPLSGNPIPQAYCAPDKTTAFSRLSRYGMTFKPLTESRGEELLTSFREAFLAKTYPQQEKAQGLTESEAECGSTWHGWLAKFDPDTSSWRTAQCSFIEDLNESLATLPRSGMTRGGLLWEQPTSVRRTNATDSGLWPTPATKGYGHASEGMVGNLMAKIESGLISKKEAEQMLCLPKLENHRTFKKKWPTPTTQDNVQIRGMGAAANSPNRGTTLGGAVRLWPTPVANEGSGGGNAKYAAMALSGTPRDSGASRTLKLRDLVKLWPTPQASDCRDRGNMSNPAIQRRAAKGKQLNLSMVAHPTSGQLNPMWVEWLMGWPLGWTDLKPLATDKFPCVQQQHGDT
jgi:hypothetical protein